MRLAELLTAGVVASLLSACAAAPPETPSVPHPTGRQTGFQPPTAPPSGATPVAAAPREGPQDLAAFRAIYKELIEINTTLSTGDCTEASRAMAAHLIAAGYPEADSHVMVPPARPRGGNLVFDIPGKDRSLKPIMLLAHLDVVEARREDWVRDPFVLTEEDGYFYARGAIDDKSMAAIWVDMLLRFKEEGYTPNQGLKLVLTCGEESPNVYNGVKYLIENHRQLVDAAYALNEGGGGRIDAVTGKKVYHGVQAGEKLYQDFRIEVTNPGGHSSRPVPDNAIYRLAAGLTRISRHTFPTEFNDATRGFFARMADLEGGDIGADMRAILRNPPHPEALARIRQNPSYNAILGTTCVATQLEAGHAPNALPQRAVANVNCRIFPGHPPEDIRAELERIVADPEVKVTLADPPETPGAPPALTGELLGVIDRLTEEMWPGVPVIPAMAAGATDGRFFTPIGIPTYGVSGIFTDPTTSNAHGLNERVGVKELYEGREFLYRLTKALAR
ncbi:M20/M25/M40 family metallo-hydrolase [bacterium]|nr:M20/M25/M40 family metallo-hydrolase [bacterium]